MGKNDFDFDFDYEKEYGFDPKAFLGNEDSEEDIDLSQFSDEDLGLSQQSGEDAAESADPDAPAEDFDLDDIDIGQFLDDPEAEAGMDYSDDASDDMEDPLTEAEEFPFSRRRTPADAPEFSDAPMEEDMQEPEMEDAERMDDVAQDTFEDAPVEDDPAPQRAPKVRKRKEKKKVKPAVPSIFTKFYDLYFAPVFSKSTQEEPQDPSNPRRRRKKTKAQIFKEVYLPPIIVCACLILVLTFAIGSVTSLIQQKRIDRLNEQSRVDESKNAAAEAEERQAQVLRDAAASAACYDYETAIKTLQSIGDLAQYPQVSAKHSEYVRLQSQLKEIQDPSTIPNLSFHVLVVDMSRALQDKSLGGKYNRNFVTTAEFSKILQQLYDNGFVLVDFNSFTSNDEGTIRSKPIYLPEGKKPIMLTETLVNYFAYMIDGNGDGDADAGGSGFASKLVLDSSGNIKAEYVDGSGNKLVGDYDLVPILESFIREHPDFSYRGARATLAVTGSEGIFGYRINSSYVAQKGQTYVDEQIAGAKAIVQALRSKGYTLACNSYKNDSYLTLNTNGITTDLQQWTQQITPVIGEVDVFVFAQESNLGDYGGASFNVMHKNGFRYFVTKATTSANATTEVNTTYVKQYRLMVTGNSMQWKADLFTGIFDCNAVIDLTVRGGSVPN